AVGSAAGIYDDIAAWTNVGSVDNKKFSGLNMTVNEDYIMSVRAVDIAGNKSAIVSSAQFLPINLASMIAWLDGADHASILDENGRNADHGLFTGSVAQWLDVSNSANTHHFSISGTPMPTFDRINDHVVFDGVDDYLTTPNHVEINTGTVTQR